MFVRGPYDLAHVANREGAAGVTLAGPEVRHRAVLPEEGVLHPVGLRVAVTDDLTGLVDPVGPTEAANATERPEVGHRAVLPEEGVGQTEGLAVPHDLARVVDVPGLGRIAAEGPDVAHRAVRPKEGARPAGSPGCPADDVAPVVEAIGIAIRATERPEVRHRAVLPEEGVVQPGRG